MSDRNVELVRTLQPGGGADLAEFFATELPPAVSAEMATVFVPSLECSFIAGEKSGFASLSYRGLEGFIAGWREWLAPWESYRIEAEEFIDAGAQVVVLARVWARTRRDGVEMEHKPAAVWTLADGQVARIEFYLERAQALADAGLAER